MSHNNGKTVKGKIWQKNYMLANYYDGVKKYKFLRFRF